MSDSKLRVNTVTYSTPTGDVSFPVSGLFYSGNPNVTKETGVFTTLLSGTLVITPTGNFIRITGESGSFSVLSGVTITGTNLNYTTGNFSTISGPQITSGVFTFATGIHNTGSDLNPAIFFSGDGDTGFAKPTTNSFRFVAGSTYVGQVNSINGLLFPGNASLSWLNASGTNRISLRARSILSQDSSYAFPTGTPSSGQILKLTNGSGNTQWSDAAANVSYQEYTSNDTWTKPPGCKVVYVECIGGGAGGGAGPRASGNLPGGRRGGAGGAGGQFASGFFAAAALSGTVSITVGAGGSGAPSVTGDNVQDPPLSGYVAGAGGYSSFGTYITTMTVSGVFAGGYSNSTGEAGVINNFYTAFGGQSGVPSGGAGYAGYLCPGGGGAGGGATSGNVTVAAGQAGGIGFGILKSSGVASIVLSGSGGTAGAASGGNGGSGVSIGDGGGGGGAGGASQAGGNGGSGAFPGGGGGGGGSSVNGFNSGAGGAGGAGVVRVYSW